MNITDEQIRSIQKTVDDARARYNNRVKAQKSIERAEFEKKCKSLGIRVIKGGKADSNPKRGPRR